MAAIPLGQAKPDPTRAANALAASATAAPSVSPLPTPIQQAPVQQVAPPQSASAETPTPGFTSLSTPAPVAGTSSPRTHAVAASEDSILARIVAGLSIPASELDVAPMHPAPVVTPRRHPRPG
ncbi:hypothetical protein NHF48_019240 [Sphingomonas sp. H160509]|uniref:hypothetical protein n=1 Tax=Sphingomonas sp. H160509 TaxID=2955313 RepID=UPI0021E963C8|nr:hypothetical protein [Sphingomonas sp. H160509]MDD1452573.1 hypothetical protein [Sphingomonas sp. H160509]